ncbi:hypothetical protein CANMA_000371 [Candida margitis]|uniref:uncharacterized protein n=1 Tax=Candida margitis TaxID=1775924 RepID=UPI0022279E41|nr:uncharacterized protein CANMA_000371 [Candida margitis]KAI5970585.1 hypothetical protein CANMA_000371 [Candida margitis]
MPPNRVVIDLDSSAEPTPTPTPEPTQTQNQATAKAQAQADPPSLDTLIIGTQDQITTLSKHAPLILPNQQPDQPYAKTLQKLRCTYNYTYLINWLYNFRGYLKLQSEFFDVDIFELELLNYFPASTYDGLNSLSSNFAPASSSVLFINKLKSSLVHVLMGNKNHGLSFEQVVRRFFGISTPLGGVAVAAPTNDSDEVIEIKENGDYPSQEQGDVDENDDSATESSSPAAVNEEDLPQFDYLLIEGKIEVLYIVISHIATTYRFKDWIDRSSSNSPEFSRIDPFFIDDNNTSTSANSQGVQTQWVLLFDNNRLYKKTIHYPQLSIPKKRKLAPEFPNEFYSPSNFDIAISDIKFDLIAKNIFEFNAYLIKLKRSKTTPKSLINKLSKSALVESLFNNEIKKRKFIANKKKEVQLAGLLAVRKRSSRLEAREREKMQQMNQTGLSSRRRGGGDGEGASVGDSNGDSRMDSQRRFERRQQRQHRQ